MEISAKLKREENLKKCDNSKVPERFKDLTDGDTVKFRSHEDLKSIGIDENNPIYFLSGRGMVINSCTVDSINEGIEEVGYIMADNSVIDFLRSQGFKGEIKVDDKISFTLEHLEYAVEKKPAVKKEVHSLRKEECTDDDIKEMISKVDKETLRKQFQIPMSIGRKPMKVSDEILDFYLTMWAKAKFPIYLAFGRNLSVSKKIEYSMEENEMTLLVNQLIKQYPKYALNIAKIPPKSFITNKMPYVGEFDMYFGDAYNEGMKVSKFFALFDDKKFDDDVSCVMQERLVKGFLTLSIDPYDYMTHAMSMHGWCSCHSLTSSPGGCKPTASFAYLIDNSNIVAYKHNGKNYLYDKGMYRDGSSVQKFDFKKNAFEGNSKSFRQLISIDMDTTSMIFSREYPKRTTSDDLRREVRNMLEEILANHLGIPNEWDNYGAELSKYEAAYTEHYYSDIQNYHSLRGSYGDTIKMDFVTVHNTDTSKIKVKDGARIYCLNCGKELHGSSVLCPDCE